MPKFEVKNSEISLSKELNEIDNFVIKTTEIIQKHVEYVIVSGYVAIFFGRSRISEDVDLFIKELSLEKFKEMYAEFVENGFEWIIEDPLELYNDYLKEGIPIGVWIKNAPLLRLDMKFPKELSQHGLFKNKIKVKFNNYLLWMADIESTIAYKEEIAKSDKDIKDSKHLRFVFNNLDETKIKRYKSLFEQEFNR